MFRLRGKGKDKRGGGGRFLLKSNPPLHAHHPTEVFSSPPLSVFFLFVGEDVDLDPSETLPRENTTEEEGYFLRDTQSIVRVFFNVRPRTFRTFRLFHPPFLPPGGWGPTLVSRIFRNNLEDTLADSYEGSWRVDGRGPNCGEAPLPHFGEFRYLSRVKVITRKRHRGSWSTLQLVCGQLMRDRLERPFSGVGGRAGVGGRVSERFRKTSDTLTRIY